MNIVWFKRDLRIHDHEALALAAKNGIVLPLYILEPELWKQPDMSYRHYAFLKDCLYELNCDLEAIGQQLIIKVGNVLDILKDIKKRHPIDGLWSHQETWNGWTYQRDKLVSQWCKENNISWQEPVQNGVVRCLKSRDGWSSHWYNQMKKPLLTNLPKLQKIKEPIDPLPNRETLGLNDECLKKIQKGGRSEGIRLLNSFLNERGECYTKKMSSIVTAVDSCSRISPHLAFGTLSMREVFQASEIRNHQVKSMERGKKGKWPSAIKSFSGRLRWHCHFIQKLEDDPRIEFENMHPTYNSLRQDDFNEDYFTAWKDGMTGYPKVDACMRSLKATGWLNFRMRAMVVSFASYHLWLDWRRPALYLATMFTDYEPGIHYSQIQMQSGTTGINAIRIYNPIKQGIDHDPDGIFIRQWIPELSDIDQEFIHMPWKSPSKMNGYPMPIVDEKTARQAASKSIYGIRKTNATHKEHSKMIVKKHASRKKVTTTKKSKAIKPNTHIQGELF